ncbi:MAG: VOC family protein [Candidatus Cyclobacteriaceae bacterium M3_2C_046]
MIEQRLTIITLGVRDLKIARDFYQYKFGWQPSDHSNENIIFFELNDIQLALFSRSDLAADARVGSEGEGFKSFTLSYNTRSESEVDQLMGQLKDKGVRVVKEPEKVHWGGYSGYIADPDGNLWEIAFNPYLIP